MSGGFQLAEAFVSVVTRLNEQAHDREMGSLRTRLAAGAAVVGAGAGAVLSSALERSLDISAGQAKLQAQMGLTTKQAANAGKAAGDVYKHGFGGSMDDVNEAIKAVGNNISDLGSVSRPELESMTQSALGLSKTFDVDVNDSTRAAGKLMKSGLAKDSKEAFDIITRGFQSGLDSSGDFLDTLNEYSPQFSKLGIDGPHALSLLSQGLKAGARDTDAVADAFKEFSIRSIDGSKTTAQGFQAIGLNAHQMAEEIGKGGPAAEKATAQTIQALQNMKDPVAQNQAGTKLFGTQWEDTVRKILPKLDLTKQSIGNVSGATDRMNKTMNSTPQAKMEQAKRTMDGWVNSLVSMNGPLGSVATGIAAMGPSGLAAAGAMAQVGTAMMAMSANPVMLTVAAIAALAIGMAIAWKKSQTFREIVTQVFSMVAVPVLEFAKIALNVFKQITSGFLTFASGLLGMAAKAFGWVPGVGDKLKSASKAVDGWKDNTNKAFDKAIAKVNDWQDSVKKMPAEIKLKGDIDDLTKKINDAKKQLSDQNLPPEKRAKLTADIANWQAQVAAAKASLENAPDKKKAILSAQISDWQKQIAQASKDLRNAPSSKKAYLKGEISDLKQKVRDAQSSINSLHGKTVKVYYQGVYQGTKNADGTYTSSTGFTYANGGIHRAANGLMAKRQAMIAPGGSYILWAENETEGEAYIPLAPGKRRRSRQIAEETVGLLGGHVDWMANGSAPYASYHTAGGGKIQIQNLNVTIPAKDLAEMRKVQDFFDRLQQTARAGQSRMAVGR